MPHNAAPIRITPGFSIWLAGLLLLVHSAALLLVCMLGLEPYQDVTLIALVLFSLVYHWRRSLLRLGSDDLIGVDWSSDRGWLVRLRGGKRMKARLRPSSFSSRHLIILHLEVSGAGARVFTIPGDAIDRNRFRRLRVLLRMQDHFGA